MPKRMLLVLLLVSVLCTSMFSSGQTALLTGKSGQPQVLFWMTNGAASVQSFLEHKNKIGILSPAWYSIDGDGMVSGEPQPVVLKAAHEAHVTLLPLFGLANFEKAHQLFGDRKAQDEMNQALVRECKQNGYAGVNLDIEDILWTDRDGLSALVERTAEVLHKEGLLVTLDAVPGAPGHTGDNAFAKWMFQEWRGGYDLAALGKAVDLLCLMTYDQNTHWTPPGPVGGWVWTRQNLEYALKAVPAEKLSLGIAVYGYHWYAGDPGLNKKEKTPNIMADSISATTARSLRDTYGGVEQWDEADHGPWFWITRDDMREWVFYTDRRAFMDRYGLARERHLEGVCSWVLGEEDPAIWAALPEAR